VENNNPIAPEIQIGLFGFRFGSVQFIKWCHLRKIQNKETVAKHNKWKNEEK